MSCKSIKEQWKGARGQGMDLWVEERHRNIFATRFKCERVLFSEKSPFQKVEVVETDFFGKMLLHDGIVMMSERDEFIYHEMIAHTPLCVHPGAERVLIIGGGDGGSAREVLKHPHVKECHLVEIDEVVIKAAKRHLPRVGLVFQNPRLKLHIEDGVRFVKQSRMKFDVVLVDSSDPVGPAKPLFDEAFYRDVLALLREPGILIVQAESPFFEAPTQRFIIKTLKSLFPLTDLYHYNNMVYPGGLWSFGWASRGGLHPLRDLKEERAGQLKGLSYYNADIHRAAFAHPEFIKNNLSSG